MPGNIKTTRKNRTPRLCREWERERRNRFNNAINELGQLLTKNENTDETENVTLPKIDIIQKAIVSIKSFMLEMSQLKSEILAQQIGSQEKKQNYKDASTQITKSIKTKLKGSKYNRLLMLKKCKHNSLKEKNSITTVTNLKDTAKGDHVNSELKNSKPNSVDNQKFPKILPRSTIAEKQGMDKAIVVLPAGPYVIPQRPLFFPTVPPAFVVWDSTLQQPNRSTVPIVTRMNNESTRTTMVNIVPITAFSHPLSVTKAKRNKFTDKVLSKTKNPSLTKKSTSNPKRTKHRKEKQSKNEQATPTNEIKEVKPISTKETVSNSVTPCTPVIDTKTCMTEISKSTKTVDIEITNTSRISNSEQNSKIKLKCSTNNNLEKQSDPNNSDIPQNKKQCSINNAPVIKNKVNADISDESNKTKEQVSEIKDKSDKLPNILDSSLCENAVDTGNARLELAEELLASSPTAAFLMSFPLVSGNRADSPNEDTQIVTNPPVNKNLEVRIDGCEERIQNSGHNIKPSQEEAKLIKTVHKSQIGLNSHKEINNSKIVDNTSTLHNKHSEAKNAELCNTSTENPFLNLPMPPILPTSCSLPDPVYALDFDCNLNKTTLPSQTSHVHNNNFLYKSDTFTAGKGSIYSTSSISAGHDYNSFSSLYPCAMEKYTSKNKSDYTTVEDNIMKAHNSRLTYDIDLGWSHKNFDFGTCTTTSNSFSKDNTYATTSVAPFSSSYNPFNPEFHVPLMSNSNKKDNTTKTTSYGDTVSNLYSQPSTLWTDEIPLYGSNNMNNSKVFTNKQQCYQPLEYSQMSSTPKINVKSFDTKTHVEPTNINKNSNVDMAQVSEKYSKKSSTKMPINWMTSETKSVQSNGYNMLNMETKGSSRNLYSSLGHQSSKKQDQCDTNYFSLPIHNFSTPMPQEDFQVWPSARPLATAEISIDPPPINLPTLVGDLALGPHEKKRNIDINNKTLAPHLDTSNCNNFFSVTHLMNRSSENMVPRYQSSNIDITNKANIKQNFNHYTNDKFAAPLLETNFVQSGYVHNDSKLPNTFDLAPQYLHVKTKSSKSTSDKNAKIHKNNYSAEAILRGGTCTQKVSDNGVPSKFIMPQQKYDFNSAQETPVAQVSHFPPILDYTENGYSSQQFTGTSLYSSATTNTMSTSFYSNLIPGSTNLMSANYNSSNFCGDFIDYNQSTECNYTSQKYEELKHRNSTINNTEKLPSTNYKASRRENTTKHKLECTKKESNKKYPNKRAKINHETEEWVDNSNLFWQNRTQNKKHGGGPSDELTFPNFGNQVTSQYQPEFFNSPLMASNVQGLPPNMDRSVASFPSSSRANFNLSTIFPEITMKVQ